MAKKTISFTLEESIAERMEFQARQEHRSISNFLEHTISCYLETARKKEVLITEYEKKGYFELPAQTSDDEPKQSETSLIEKEMPKMVVEEKRDEKIDAASEKTEERMENKDSILNHLSHNLGTKV